MKSFERGHLEERSDISEFLANLAGEQKDRDGADANVYRCNAKTTWRL